KAVTTALGARRSRASNRPNGPHRLPAPFDGRRASSKPRVPADSSLTSLGECHERIPATSRASAHFGSKCASSLKNSVAAPLITVAPPLPNLLTNSKRRIIKISLMMETHRNQGLGGVLDDGVRVKVGPPNGLAGCCAECLRDVEDQAVGRLQRSSRAPNGRHHSAGWPGP